MLAKSREAIAWFRYLESTINHHVNHLSESFPHFGVFYDIEAVYVRSRQPALIRPGATYTFTINYDEATISDGVDKVDLALFYWDGEDWVRELSRNVDVENYV